MNILVIGGTQFVGRHFVACARAAGHDVTLFNRGKTNPELFSDLETVVGDRFQDIAKLTGHWDAVVDTSAYLPKAVRIAGEHLEDRVERYVFVSTTAVYRDMAKKGLDESAYLKTLEDPDVEELNRSTYGPLKTECEAVAKGIFGKRCFIVRPNILIGPHDPTDRFTYWVSRVGQGGDVLAPGNPAADIQLLDARDLATWLVEGIETKRSGTYNAAGPTISFRDMLDACRQATDSDATFTWVDEAFLRAAELDEAEKMPLWNAEGAGRTAGCFAIDSSKALSQGLTRRPLVESARDIWEWIESDWEEHEWRAGIDLLEERQILGE